MRKYKQKELRDLVRLGAAEDYTNKPSECAYILNRLEKVGYSMGIYVINGDWYEAAAEDASGNLYTVYWCPDNMDDPDTCDWSTPAAIVSMCPWCDVTSCAVICTITAVA